MYDTTRCTALVAILFLLSACAASPSSGNATDHHAAETAATAARPPHQAALASNGLHYELAGAGPVVVMIHGSNLDRRLWHDDMAWLQHHARVLAYDLRGQGESHNPAAPYYNHGDLLDLLDLLGMQRPVTLIGLSSGAQVALDTALTAPERVNRLILVSPSLTGYVPEQMADFFTPLTDALLVGDFAQANQILLDSPVMAVPESHQPLVETMVEDNTRLWTIDFSLLRTASPPAIQRLPAVSQPSLILVGTEDLDAVHAQGTLLNESIEDSALVLVEDGGHLLNLTSPEAFQTEIMDFLDLSPDP